MNKLREILILIFLSSFLFEMGIKFFIESLYGFGFFKLSMAAILLTFPLSYRSRLYNNYRLSNIHKILFLLVGYYIFSLLGLLYSDFVYEGFVKVSIPMVWIISVFLVIHAFEFMELKKIKGIFFWAGLLSILVIIFFTYLNFSENYDLVDLYKSTLWVGISPFSDRNVLVEVLLYSILLVYYSYSGRRADLLLLLLLLFVFALGIVVGSRRIFVFEFIVGVVFFATLWLKSRKLFYKYILVLTIFVGTVLGFFGNFGFGMMKFDTLTIERSLSIFAFSDFESGRKAHVQEALDVVEDFEWYNLVFGKGTSGYLSMVNEYPHNFVLSALIEGGILKLFLVVFILIFYIKVFFSVYNRLDQRSVFFIISLFLIFVFARSISYQEIFMDRIFLFLIMSLYMVMRYNGSKVEVFQVPSRNSNSSL